MARGRGPRSGRSRPLMFNRSLHIPILLAGLLSPLGACSASTHPPTAADAEVEIADGAVSGPEPQTASSARMDEIDADEIWDKQAETACAEGRFSGFFEAFVRSRSVAQHYTARRVSLVRGASRTEVIAYGGAPITLMDHRWVTAASAARGAPFDRVDLRIDQSGDNRVLVEWRPVEYAAPGPEAEEGRILRQTGPTGALLFAPTGHCWELVEDRIRPDESWPVAGTGPGGA